MKQIIIQSLLSLFIAVSAASVAYAESRGDWMGRISDDTYVCSISIPGTHDSCTYGIDFLEKWGKCQNLNLEDQFDCGIRCFDFRPAGFIYGDVCSNHRGKYDGKFNLSAYMKEMPIIHGPLPCGITFWDAMQTLVDLAKKHPTEFIVVMVNQESGEQEQLNKVSLVVTQMVEWEFSRNNPGMFVQFRPDLKLGEVRGKILVINRDDYLSEDISGSEFHFDTMVHDWVMNPRTMQMELIFFYQTIELTCSKMPQHNPVGVFTANFDGEDEAGYLRIGNASNEQGQAKMYSQDKFNPSSREDKGKSFFKTCHKYNSEPDYYCWCINNVSGYFGSTISMDYKDQSNASKPYIAENVKTDGQYGVKTLGLPGAWHGLGIVYEDFAGSTYSGDMTFEDFVINMNNFVE